MTAHETTPLLAGPLALVDQLRYRSRTLASTAAMICHEQRRGNDLAWVPDAAVQMLTLAATELASWATSIDDDTCTQRPPEVEAALAALCAALQAPAP